MTAAGRQYPFARRASGEAVEGLLPMLPLTLSAAKRVEVSGLLDTGATINVLPFSTGVELGFEWDRQTTTLRLGGNLAAAEARAVAVSAVVGDLPAVRLGFAWTRSDQVPVILGQMNFFLEFDVCFFRSLQHFEIRPSRRTRETP